MSKKTKKQFETEMDLATLREAMRIKQDSKRYKRAIEHGNELYRKSSDYRKEMHAIVKSSAGKKKPKKKTSKYLEGLK